MWPIYQTCKGKLNFHGADKTASCNTQLCGMELNIFLIPHTLNKMHGSMKQSSRYLSSRIQFYTMSMLIVCNDEKN